MFYCKRIISQGLVFGTQDGIEKRNIVTQCCRKNGGLEDIDMQTALDFKFSLDVVARKDTFKKISVTNQKSLNLHTPLNFCNSS